MIFEELLCAGRGQGDMASLPRRMESGWVQLFGRWIDKDLYITVVSFSRWSHLVAASIFWPWQFCLDTGGLFLFHKIIVEAFQNRRKGARSSNLPTTATMVGGTQLFEGAHLTGDNTHFFLESGRCSDYVFLTQTCPL